MDERDAAVTGELLNHCFWVHHVAAHSTPLVHISSSRRAEIVEFGDDIHLVPPFEILAGDFTIIADKGDSQCTVSRFSVRHGTRRVQCGLSLDQVLHTLATLGGQYPDAFELVREADRSQALSCPLAVDALPRAVTLEELAHRANEKKDKG